MTEMLEMTEMVFPSSAQQAIKFVVTHLVWPQSPSGWERPNWDNFTWFTKIVLGDIRVVEPSPSHHEDDIVVQRIIRFFLGEDKVAVITMEGLRVNDSISWTVRRVSYQLHWQTGGDETKWVHWQLITSSYLGLPPKLAPVG